MKASAYIRNRCFNPRTNKTPIEVLTGRKPNVGNMHIFGSVCYAYIHNCKKLDPCCVRGVFVGYDGQSPAYLVYLPDREEVRRVRCVRFTDKFEVEMPKTVISECGSDSDVECPLKPQGHQPDEKYTDQTEDKTETGRTFTDEGNVRKNPLRVRNPPRHLNEYVVGRDDDGEGEYAGYTLDYCHKIWEVPNTYLEAVQSTESHLWQRAMEEEIEALTENDTFELTVLPQDRSVVGSRWVFTQKNDPSNGERYKARFVAKGFSQVQGVDYHETFSPTARLTSLRMLLQLAVQNDFLIHQMDVKTAYLNANIDCEVYLEQPEGFAKTDENGNRLVCKLKKSLYGLKQSGRNWYNLLHDTLVEEKFEQFQTDHCVYKRVDENSTVLILFWVDDIIIFANDEVVLSSVKMSLCMKFKMQDLGKLSWFLGTEFVYNDDCVIMNQKKYCEKILARFNMPDCKPKCIPCDPGISKIVDSEYNVLGNLRLYREIVGSLMYIMTATRPDLCFAVTKLSQFMSKPTVAHLGLAKYVLRYIKGTFDHGLKFCKSETGLKLTGYCDSDWGSSGDRHSVMGYCFKLNNQDPLISWKSKKQRIVALSTCEAEYVSISYAVQECNFLSQLYVNVTGSQRDTALIFVDNQGAIALAKNPVYHQKSKHIDIKYHFVRSQIEDRSVELVYVPSDENVADMFTKPISKSKLLKFSVIKG